MKEKHFVMQVCENKTSLCVCVWWRGGGGRKGQASERRGTEGISEVGEERAGSGVLRV